ncbi:hypothetical protein [Acidiphilium acidophilum]|uniref:Uncharacterized protein n=1 Tax=Acidiphilium acidophilum TaxID=76588 RepID=A0AAW9DNE8_ACIAO|nr:hypothetical protein [Acidiphilium acidophilum]MDX5930079.1 hypothetical protein [Acidiphilium acidophilum]
MAGREGEGFIFEKKKQKTFGGLGLGRFRRHSPGESEFFCFFFYKKRSASVLDLGLSA